MSLLEQVRQGSFRGIPFDTVSISRERIKKNTEHKFANSIRRYIEERGVQDADFSLTFSVFGGYGGIGGENTNAKGYIQRRDELRTALEKEGAGLLVIPLEGEFNVKCTKVSDSQNITESFGRCDFTADFKVVSKKDAGGNPVKIKNNTISMADKVKQSKMKMMDIVANNFAITKALSMTQSVNKFSSLASTLSGYANMADGSDLASIALTMFNSNLLTNYLGDPKALASGVSGLFTSLEMAYSNSSELLSCCQAMFSFGDNDAIILPTTVDKIEQSINQQVINAQVQTEAVATASNAVGQIDFANSDDLNNVSVSINNQYDKLIANSINTSILGSGDMVYLLKKMKTDFNDIIDEKLATTPKVQVINVNSSSLKLIAYQYYGNLNNYDNLISLNKISNPREVSGEIRIFTNV